MKKLALVGALAVAACTPDIPKTTAVEHPIVAFDPAAAVPVVPTPNDLAIDPTTGKVNAPIDPNASAADQEFIRDYVNTLDGFPEGTAAASTAILGGELDPATVNAGSVLVTDVTAALSGQDPTVAATIQYDPEGKRIVVLPPNGAWTPGHKYDVALVSGPDSGLQLQGGGQVFASPVWALARSAQPLVSCTPDNVCHSTTSAISDPAQAQQLDQLRAGYAPLLDLLAQNGVARENVALLWTFSIVSHEMRFDPANQVIPFPNDLVTDPATGQVTLPFPTLPDGGTDTTSLQGQLIGGLNTLDGFSTTAPLVTENAEDASALNVGEIDPASVTASAAMVVPLAGVVTAPQVAPCVFPGMAGCSTTTALPDGGYALPDGGAVPQQLQLIPQAPLDEKASYAGVVTTDLKATDGKQVSPSTVFALMRMSNSLLSGGHSTVTGVTDEQAQQLEPVRVALKPLFDGLAANGLPRNKLALAWSFHTQSEQSILYQLAQAPAGANVPVDPITLVESSVLLTCGTGCPYPVDAIAHAFSGSMISPFALTGPGGTLNPSAPLVHTIPFILTLPSGTMPANGWPVVIFGHGLSGNRTQAMAIANSLAQGGFAMVATDEVWHGERLSCTGVGPFASAIGGIALTDDSVCVSPGGAPSDPGTCDEGFPIGHCVAGPTATDFGADCTFLSPTAGDTFCQSQIPSQGQCRPTANGQPGPSKCDGSDFKRDAKGQPALGNKELAGWNLFNLANLFATRDNFRQQVIDDAQLARVVAGGDATDISAQLSGILGAATQLDGTQIHYVGQSLGGILGTLYTSSDPAIHKTVLNVPAGDLLGIFMTTPNADLGALRNGFIATLASQGIAFGTPAFDNFLGIGKWILDPADPVNAGHALWNGPGAPADRQAFIQYIENDQILPNPTTEELVAATLRPGEETCTENPAPPCADVFEFTDADFGADMPADPVDRHGFLLNGKGAVTAKGQSQVIQFLVSGQVNPAP